MSISLMLPEDRNDTPTIMDEYRKSLLIRQLVKEVDWADTEVLIADMPPGTGEEVRGLLGIEPRAAVVVTSPQRMSESAVRKVVVTSPQRMSESAVRKALVMAEYRIPWLGLIETNPYGTTGEVGEKLSQACSVPLLAQVPWSEEAWTAMESQVPFDHQAYLPVVERVKSPFFVEPAPPMPTKQAESTCWLRPMSGLLGGGRSRERRRQPPQHR